MQSTIITSPTHRFGVMESLISAVRSFRQFDGLNDDKLCIKMISLPAAMPAKCLMFGNRRTNNVDIISIPMLSFDGTYHRNKRKSCVLLIILKLMGM